MYIFCGIAPYITDFQSHNHDLRVGEDDGNCHNSGGGGDLNDDDVDYNGNDGDIIFLV